MDKIDLNYLIYIRLPTMLKKTNKDYVDGYTYGLYVEKILTFKQFNLIRATYWNFQSIKI